MVSYFSDRTAVEIAAQIQKLRKQQINSKEKVPDSKRITKVKVWWTKEEHSKLEDGIRQFGNDYTRIAKLVGSKNREQVHQKVIHSKRTLESFPKVEEKVKKRWTSDEAATYMEVVEKYGRDMS